MMLESDIPRCSRVCCRTHQPLLPGETYYSALVEGERGEWVRLDFSPVAWNPEREKAVGWWRSTVPTPNEKKFRLAANDILAQLFDQWLGDAEKSEYLYILTLLMVRRRILRFEKTESSETAFGGSMVVYSPRRETSWSIPVVELPPDRIETVQQCLADLIFAGSDNQ